MKNLSLMALVAAFSAFGLSAARADHKYTNSAHVSFAPEGTPGAAASVSQSATPPKVDHSFPTNVYYPKRAQAQGEQGKVVISLELNSSGNPTGRYAIAKSSGFNDLDTAALQTALNWHYLPARDANGVTQSAIVHVEVDYKLPETGHSKAK